mmetsp:Transcript_12738/g.31096  ORF Transcript_12738/g.31096 Transcript_12738/m.31096 type:complete len:291 (-) Transcript_12738:116-988(-)
MHATPNGEDGVMLVDSLMLMMEQERTTYAICNCLNSNPTHTTGRPALITPNERAKIVDWCYTIVDQCQYNRENVAIAMNIVDRFANEPSSRDVLRDQMKYQLVAVTALYISNKLYEQFVIGSDGFSALTQGMYSVEEIEAMELRILHCLSWRLCPPTALQIGYRILALINVGKIRVEKAMWHSLQDEIAYQIEISIPENYFTTEWPSTVAMAAILNAIESVGRKCYEDLIKGLLRVLKVFHFDSPIALLAAKAQLQYLVEENDNQHDDNNVPEITQDRATEMSEMVTSLL